ncbi:MAG: two-component regulator propeller domain-containing protein, partial [Flavobacteriales bacterium]
MPSNNIRCLHKGPRGFMWIGTSAGLVRYDGNQKKVYTTNDGLPSNKIWAICDGPEGNLWVGTYGGGTVYYDGDTFHTPSRDSIKGPKNIRTLYHHEESQRIFAGGEKGFASMNTDTVYDHFKKRDNGERDRYQIAGFYSFGQDSILVLPIYGKAIIYNIKDKGYEALQKNSPFDMLSFSSLEKGDSMIIGGNGLRIVENEKILLDFQAFRKKWKKKKGAIWDITANGQGDLWVAIWGGNRGENGALFRVDSSGYHPMSRTYGIDSETFWSCEYDRENELLFVGTLG